MRVCLRLRKISIHDVVFFLVIFVSFLKWQLQWLLFGLRGILRNPASYEFAKKKLLFLQSLKLTVKLSPFILLEAEVFKLLSWRPSQLKKA